MENSVSSCELTIELNYNNPKSHRIPPESASILAYSPFKYQAGKTENLIDAISMKNSPAFCVQKDTAPDI
jgi:hypothetical protein